MTFQMTIKTAQEVAAERAAGVTALARRECQRRIYEVVPIEKQMNLSLRQGGLAAGDRQTLLAGLQWVDAMRAAWRTMAAEGKDPLDDASWPKVPDGLVAWLADY